MSKTFDYATSCSSENSLFVHDQVYERARRAAGQGAYLLTPDEKARLQQVMWLGGKTQREVTAQ